MDYSGFDFLAKPTNKADLSSELLYKLMKRPTKDSAKIKNHYQVYGAKYQYQADILFLPDDDGFRYALVVVDMANGLTDAYPLKSKTSTEVLIAFKHIFSNHILPIPKRMITIDSGSEFKGVVTDYFMDKSVIIKRSKPDRHQQTAFVESRNRIIGRITGMRQNTNELATGERDTTWVDLLPTIITAINKSLTKSPEQLEERKEAIIKAPFRIDRHNKTLINMGTKVRIALDAPQDIITKKKLHGRFRATDLRFEPTIRTVEDIELYPNTQPLYKISGIPRTAYTRNQIQVVGNDEKPIHPTKFVVERILAKKGTKYKIKWKGYDAPSWEPISTIKKDVPSLVKSFEH